MSNAIIIISKVMPVVFLILLGNILRRFHFFNEAGIEDFKKAVVNISLPALLFITFSETVFEARYFYIILLIFIICCLMLLFGNVMKMLLKIQNEFYPALFSGFEVGMLGYSMYAAVYGTENIFKMAVIDIGHVIFVFFVMVSYLNKLNGTAASLKNLVMGFIKTPVIFAIAAGVLFSITGAITYAKEIFPFNSILEAVKLAGNLTIPLICIVIGYELKVDIRNIRIPLATAVLRLVSMLILAFIIDYFVLRMILDLDIAFRAALYTIFILPPPFIIPIYMKTEESKRQVILNTISLSIILSLIAYIGVIMILR